MNGLGIRIERRNAFSFDCMSQKCELCHIECALVVQFEASLAYLVENFTEVEVIFPLILTKHSDVIKVQFYASALLKSI